MANYDSYFLKYWWHELIMTCWKLTGIWYSFYYSMVTTYYYFSLSVAHRCTPLLFSSFSSPHLTCEWLKFFLLWLSFQLVLQCQISERYDRITLLLEDISDGSKRNSDSSGWHLHFSVTWPPSPLFPTFTSSSHQWFCQLSDCFMVYLPHPYSQCHTHFHKHWIWLYSILFSFKYENFPYF